MTRTALVTGVSRRQGIGFALARRLLDDGHRVFARSWSPYHATKATLGAITATLTDAVAGQGITVNCVNPGPTDTGWATPEHAAVAALPLSRDADSITGQVVDAEGGSRRFIP